VRRKEADNAGPELEMACQSKGYPEKITSVLLIIDDPGKEEIFFSVSFDKKRVTVCSSLEYAVRHCRYWTIDRFCIKHCCLQFRRGKPGDFEYSNTGLILRLDGELIEEAEVKNLFTTIREDKK